MPAPAIIRGLDNVKTSLDLFKPFPELSKGFTEILDTVFSKGIIRNIFYSQSQKVRALPSLYAIEQNFKMIAEPFLSTPRTGPIPARQFNLQIRSTMGTIERFEGMIFSHFLPL